MNPVELMVDLETLSQRPTAAIMSIAAVAFHVKTHAIVGQFHVNVEPTKGYHIDPSTIDWWKQQDPEVLKQLTVNQVSMKSALTEFKVFCQQFGPPNTLKFWAHGGNFDFPILDNAFITEGIDTYDLWRFWNLQCSRTIMNVAGIDMRNHRGEGHHHPLQDCNIQAKYLIKALYSDA